MNFADKKMHSLNDAESPAGFPLYSRNARMKLRYKLTLEYDTSDLRRHLPVVFFRCQMRNIQPPRWP